MEESFTTRSGMRDKKSTKPIQKQLSPLPFQKRPSERVRDAIEEAIANGAFDHLPGAGKPLDFSDDENPFVPADMRLAWRMLRQHGLALPWIEDRREIDTRRAALDRRAERHLERMRSAAAAPPSLPPHLRRYREGKLKAEHAEFVRRQGEEIDRLNEKIDLYNLAVPSINLQTHRINRERALARLDAGLPESSP
jgi:hypothetical protein